LVILTEELVWRLSEGVTLSWRCWGDEAVVFNVASGQTHLLDPFSEWVLRELEGSPGSLGGLVDRLSVEAGLEKSLAIRRLREVLVEFDKQGLVESNLGPR
jgi:PqqD family protein of HPr-rel-A system